MVIIASQASQSFLLSFKGDSWSFPPELCGSWKVILHMFGMAIALEKGHSLVAEQQALGIQKVLGPIHSISS